MNAYWASDRYSVRDTRASPPAADLDRQPEPGLLLRQGMAISLVERPMFAMPCTWQGCSAISSIAVVVLSDTAMTRMDLPEPTASEMIVPQHPPWIAATEDADLGNGCIEHRHGNRWCIRAAPPPVPTVHPPRRLLRATRHHSVDILLQGRCASIHRTASSKLIPGRSKLIDSAPMCVGLVATPGTKIPYMPSPASRGSPGAMRERSRLTARGSWVHRSIRIRPPVMHRPRRVPRHRPCSSPHQIRPEARKPLFRTGCDVVSCRLGSPLVSPHPKDDGAWQVVQV